jgi:predicted PhzF superfamily epimerase YddE/YHI9
MVVDVFRDVSLARNQPAVFTDARGLTSGEMQALAWG